MTTAKQTGQADMNDAQAYAGYEPENSGQAIEMRPLVTHPLTAGNYSDTTSVLATHPELAAPVFTDPGTSGPAYLALLTAATEGVWSDAETGASCPETMAR